jgi:hypothetical protein
VALCGFSQTVPASYCTPASARVTSAAGLVPQPVAFWPHHSGVKSPEPFASARAQRRDAGGRERKLRRGFADRPELSHDAIDDPSRGPAGEYVRERRVPRRFAPERGGDAFRVGDASGRDHRHAHRFHDLRQQRERTDLRRQIVRKEDAAVSSAEMKAHDARLERLERVGGFIAERRAPGAGGYRTRIDPEFLVIRRERACALSPPWAPG